MKRGGKLEKGLRTAGEYVLSIGVFVLIWWIYVFIRGSFPPRFS